MTVLVHRLLGELFIEIGLIRDEQLEEALAVQKNTHERIGQILLGLGYINDNDLAKGLGRQLGIPYVSLSGVLILDDAVAAIPASMVKRHRVLPLEIIGGKLIIAMADPADFYAMDDVRAVCDMEIEAVIAAEGEIKRVIQEVYGAKELVAKASKIIGGNLVQEEVVRQIDDAPMIDVVNMVISQAVREKASDIHIEPLDDLLRVRFRVDGILREVFSFPIKIQPLMISRLKIMSALDIVEKRIPQDGRIHYLCDTHELDLRISTIPTILGEKIVIRILNRINLITEISALGFSAENLQLYQKICRKSQGMLLVTGPTGSGKSTTLYATLMKLNDIGKNIVTIENPVEYRLNGINQMQVNDKVGLTFAACLRAVLRQDPNIIMIGEIRDKETADIAFRAALTGHLVFSTLHTVNATGAILRLLDMGVKPFLLASSLVGVVAQRLVRVICSDCKATYHPPADSAERVWLRSLYTDALILYKGSGCLKCAGTGYKGRIAVNEILYFSKDFKESFLLNYNRGNLQNFLNKQCLKSMYADGLEKVLQGVTTVEEVSGVVSADDR